MGLEETELNELQQAMNERVESGSDNPALTAVIHEYANYHAVLVIVGALMVILFSWLSIRFWRTFKQTPRMGRSKWSFEKKVYFSFGLLSSILALLMVLIAFANATNTFNPQHGFSLFVDSFGTSKGEPHKEELRDAFIEWIRSGNANTPLIFKQPIEERIKFHTTKAMICGVLLIPLVVLSKRIWNTLINRTKAVGPKWKGKDYSYFIIGNVTVVFSLLLIIIVAANLQGAFAPLAAFLVGLI